MNETFDHLFGGWKKAPARRWTNPDGSRGGIVAVDTRLHPGLIVPADATVWPGASIGDGASIGHGASIGDGASIGYRASIGGGASIGDGDWWISSSPIGEHNRIVTAVFSKKYGLRWWVGCQHEITTERFYERLNKDHCPDGRLDTVAEDYLHFIGYVLSHPGLARAQAGAA